MANGDQLLGRYRHGRQSLKPYNLVLLDYEMPVTDGFTAAREIRERYDHSVVIVVITKYKSKAYEASRFQPFYYCWKPEIGGSQFQADFLRAYRVAARQESRSFIVEYQGRGTRLLYEEIQYIEKQKGGPVLFHTDRAALPDHRSLREIMALLERRKDNPFYLVYRSVAVNLAKVSKVDPPGRYLLCGDGVRLEISRAEAKRTYQAWLRFHPA